MHLLLKSNHMFWKAYVSGCMKDNNDTGTYNRNQGGWFQYRKYLQNSYEM